MEQKHDAAHATLDLGNGSIQLALEGRSPVSEVIRVASELGGDTGKLRADAVDIAAYTCFRDLADRFSQVFRVGSQSVIAAHAMQRNGADQPFQLGRTDVPHCAADTVVNDLEVRSGHASRSHVFEQHFQICEAGDCILRDQE